MQKNKMKLQILHYYYRIIILFQYLLVILIALFGRTILAFNNKNLNSDMYIDYS